MSWEFKCPPGWVVIHPWGDGFALRQVIGGLRVIVDCEQKADGLPWLHVSVSRQSWTPTHEDMAMVKHDFIGPDRYAYSIWPPADRYINIHAHCLHLWARMDESEGRVLPEFSADLPGIGPSV
jgi:hypothetical protein